MYGSRLFIPTFLGVALSLSGVDNMSLHGEVDGLKLTFKRRASSPTSEGLLLSSAHPERVLEDLQLDEMEDGNIDNLQLSTGIPVKFKVNVKFQGSTSSKLHRYTNPQFVTKAEITYTDIIYTGDILKGKPHGYGTFIKKNKKFQGYGWFQDGILRIGRVTFLKIGGSYVYYEGSFNPTFNLGIAGKGIVFTKLDQYIVGRFDFEKIKDLAHTSVENVKINKRVYESEINIDFRQFDKVKIADLTTSTFNITHTKKNGEEYIGTFTDEGNYEKGKITYVNNYAFGIYGETVYSSYEGSFDKDDKPHGFGTFSGKDRKIFEGEVEEGRYIKGQLYNWNSINRTQYHYVGKFANTFQTYNVPYDRYGKLINSESGELEYFGEFKNNLLNGRAYHKANNHTNPLGKIVSLITYGEYQDNDLKTNLTGNIPVDVKQALGKYEFEDVCAAIESSYGYYSYGLEFVLPKVQEFKNALDKGLSAETVQANVNAGRQVDTAGEDDLRVVSRV